MYCKHCGKPIDDDSTFCKHCGKPLDRVSNPLISHFNLSKKNIVYVVLLVIWVLFAAIYSIDKAEEVPLGAMFSSFIVTPFIIWLIYWLYSNSCKYPIHLIDKTDSTKIKLVKYAYLAYTYFIPFSCMDEVYTNIDEYFSLLIIFWFLPSLIICGIYYFVKSRKAVK